LVYLNIIVVTFDDIIRKQNPRYLLSLILYCLSVLYAFVFINVEQIEKTWKD